MSEKENDLNVPQEENQVNAAPEAKVVTTPEETAATVESDDTEDVAAQVLRALQESKSAQMAEDLLSKEEETPAEEEVAPLTEDASIADDDVDEEEPAAPVYTEDKEDEETATSIEERDYSAMSEDEIMAAVEELVQLEDKKIEFAYKEMKRAKEVMSKYFETQREAAKEAFVASGGEVDGFKFEASTQNQAFFEQLNAMKTRRAQYYEQMNKERDKNLKRKREILDEIKSLTESDDISKVTSRSNTDKIKAIQQEWQDLGPVPKMEAEELYRSYRALLDIFYDRKRMAYDLQRLDREKNLEIKKILCDKAEALLTEENINEAVRQLNVLHDDYKAAGPVPRAQQEELWQRFKKASDILYDKKRAYAEEYKVQLQENMELKQALCLRAESYVSFNSDSIREWNKVTKELLALQEEWEKIGQLPREVAKDINRQFWTNFKQFFSNKNQFFEALDAARTDNLRLKEALCEKAEALQESNEWNEAGDALKELQQEWRAIGPVPEKFKDSIYERFKKACDTFFERRRNRKQAEEQVFVDNLKKKEAFCAQIDELTKAGSTDEAALQEIKAAFMAVGFVPRRSINDITDKFAQSVDAFFANFADVDEAEREQKSLKVLIDVINDGGSSDRSIGNKRQALRNKINTIEDEIALLQNNLAFFGKSKNAQKLIEDFGVKIEKAQQKLEKLRRQYSIFNKLEEQ